MYQKDKSNSYKIVVAFLIIILSLNGSIYSQTYTYPSVEVNQTGNVYIKSVAITNYYTEVNFYYHDNNVSRYIYLSPPNHKNAMFIRAGGKIYKLIQTKNIGNTDGTTSARQGETLEFTAYFEQIPINTGKFDLIEGESGNWNFFGITLQTTTHTEMPDDYYPPPQIENAYQTIDPYDYVRVAIIVGWKPKYGGIFYDFDDFASKFPKYLIYDKKAAQQMNIDACYYCKINSDYYFGVYNNNFKTIPRMTWDYYCPYLYALLQIGLLKDTD